jgi:hypothetical protein
MDHQENQPGATHPEMTRAGGVRDTAGTIKDDTRRLARDAREGTAQVASRALEEAGSRVASRKDEAAGQVGSLASAMRQAGEQLETGDAAFFARYAGVAADELDKVSSWLRGRDLQTIMRDTETFARRHPDIFMGGAFVAGIMLARFLKSSSPATPTELTPAVTSAPVYEPDTAPLGASPLSAMPAPAAAGSGSAFGSAVANDSGSSGFGYPSTNTSPTTGNGGQ